MVVTLIAGTTVGIAVGGLMARGRICFNSGLRDAVFNRRFRIPRIFGLAIATQLVALPAVVALGVPVSRPGLYPVAELAGGLVFGSGMALAGGCITGILWKTGAGSVATAIAIAGFIAGELLMRGPWHDLAGWLDSTGPRPATTTLYAATGTAYAAAALPLGAVGLALLLGKSRNGMAFGLSLGILGVLAWVAADWADYGYGLGFVGSAQNVKAAIAAHDAERLTMEPVLAAGVVIGAALAVRSRLRSPGALRATRALAGGVLMGIGGNLAHGCNIGHGLTGVPLLGFGSMLAIAAMALGATFTAWLMGRRHRSEPTAGRHAGVWS